MTLVKICGLRDVNSVKAADQADYAGFVVGSPRSHRNISLKRYHKLRKHLTNAIPVIVTVNHSLQFLHELQRLPDVIVQLHGKSRMFSEFIANSALGLNLTEFKEARFNYLQPYSFLSIDSTTVKGYGGTGETWTWEELTSFNPTLVAGGISFDNAEEAIKKTKASGVDVSTSLEINRKKDPQLISDFIEMVKAL